MHYDLENMGKLEHVFCLALGIASLANGDTNKRLDIHGLFHTISNGNLSRSDISMQLLVRSADQPITSGTIKVTGMDKENTFVPFSNYADEENKETTVR